MVGIAIAALISFGWATFSLWLGPALGWVDAPDNPELKVHERPVVPLGGVGIFLGVHTALALTGGYDVGLAAASGMVLLLGLVDDRIGLTPKLRLLVEVAAGIVLVTQADVGVSGWLGIAVGTALVVFAINAVNLYDGLDGLVGSTALITGLGIAWLTYAQFSGDGYFGLVLAGALFGFLVLNWNPAKVFLGDNGAYTVAVFIAYGILRAGWAKHGAVVRFGSVMVDVKVWIAIGLLGVFALDLFVTLLRRRLHHRPLFEGDRSHVYDQLRDRGQGIKQIALMSAGLQGLLVVAVVVADQVLGGIVGLITLMLVALGSVAAARYFGFLRA